MDAAHHSSNTFLGDDIHGNIVSFFLFSWKFALNSPVAQLLISLLQERKTINDGVYFLPNFGFWIFLAFNVPIYFQ